MTSLASRLPAEALPALGWALVHFLWQGAALAALAAALMTLSRSAAVRYAIGLALLASMAALPIVTAAVYWDSTSASQRHHISSLGAQVESPQPAPGTLSATTRSVLGSDLGSDRANVERTPFGAALPREALHALVALWLAGVAVFSLRTVFGLLVVRRWVAEPLERVTGRLHETCLEVQHRLGVRRLIRYCRSTSLDTPAAVGWLRPVVILPATVLTGLTEQQLRLVVAHELAHIRRLDPLVNLLQIAVETLLFYHPAVWWLNRRIRVEREHCCDDVALAACEHPLEYARALAFVAGLRRAPRLAMAANRGPLVQRVARILGADGEPGPWSRGARAAGSLLCLASALVAGGALVGLAPLGTAVAAVDRVAPQARSWIGSDGSNDRPTSTEVAAAPAPRGAETVVAPPTSTADPTEPRTARAESEPSPSAPRLSSAGRAPQSASRRDRAPERSGYPVDALTVEQRQAFAAHGVTLEYIRRIRAAGLDPDADDLVALRIHGVTPEYVAELGELGVALDSVDDVLAVRVHGVSADYVRRLRATGLAANDRESIVAMRVHGVTPEYAKALFGLGLEADAERVIEMRVHGVEPEYIPALREQGLAVSLDAALDLRIHGVTPDYIAAMRAAGFEPSAEEVLDLRVHGVTVEYVVAMRDSGATPSIEEIVEARVHGLTPEFVAEARRHGFADLDLSRLIQLKHLGVLDAATKQP